MIGAEIRTSVAESCKWNSPGTPSDCNIGCRRRNQVSRLLVETVLETGPYASVGMQSRATIINVFAKRTADPFVLTLRSVRLYPAETPALIKMTRKYGSREQLHSRILDATLNATLGNGASDLLAPLPTKRHTFGSKLALTFKTWANCDSSQSKLELN